MHNLHISIESHVVEDIQRVDVGGRQATLITMKMPPEMSSQRIQVNRTHIDIAGVQCRGVQVCNKCLNIPDRIQHMTTDDNISPEISRCLFPRHIHAVNVMNTLLRSVTLQETEHCTIWFYRNHALHLRSKSQRKTASASTHVQHSCFSGHFSLHTLKKWVAGYRVLCRLMKSTRAPIPIP